MTLAVLPTIATTTVHRHRGPGTCPSGNRTRIIATRMNPGASLADENVAARSSIGGRRPELQEEVDREVDGEDEREGQAQQTDDVLGSANRQEPAHGREGDRGRGEGEVEPAARPPVDWVENDHHERQDDRHDRDQRDRDVTQGHRPPARIHSAAPSGLTVASIVVTRWRWSDPRSISSRSWTPNASIASCASTRARLNRRSTARCTRARSGWNSAAASSVDAATASVLLVGDRGEQRLEPDDDAHEHAHEDDG